MQEEKLLKRFLKRRCKVTLAFVTAFLITGSLAMASEKRPIISKRERYRNSILFKWWIWKWGIRKVLRI